MPGLPRPDAPRVLAIVQAGGQGSRLDVLTRERAKPALPFAGTYQLVDIALSNLANSGIDDVWVSVQYQAASLDEHLQSGRPWDLDRTAGGYRRLVPEEGSDGGGFSAGNADDLARMLTQIDELDPDVVVTASADQVFRLDLREVVYGHLDRGSECTIVTTEVTREQASDKAVLVTDGERVIEIHEKPKDPPSTTISAEILVFDAAVLRATLEEVRRARTASEPGEDTGLGDLPEHLLPALVERGRVATHALPGYWKDMGRPALYLAAHRDLVAGEVDVFDDPRWPMRSNQPDALAPRVRAGAELADAVISPGCVVSGTVRRSTLGPDVVVEEGAVVEDSVLFGQTVIAAGAQVRTAIVDAGVRIGAGARVGASPAQEGDARDEEIVLVGRDSVVGDGEVIAAGARLEPGTTA